MRLSDFLYQMDANPNVHKYLWNKTINKHYRSNWLYTLVQEQYKTNKIGRFVVILKETNELIGWAGLKYNTEISNKSWFFMDIYWSGARKRTKYHP
jgi:RimJ/RimL family protein N-acetyltransferase